jgi:hypothetical protein
MLKKRSGKAFCRKKKCWLKKFHEEEKANATLLHKTKFLYNRQCAEEDGNRTMAAKQRTVEDEDLKKFFEEMIVNLEPVEWLEPRLKTWKLFEIDLGEKKDSLNCKLVMEDWS